MVTLLFPATGGGIQFEVPQEVVGLLEVRANCVDLVDQECYFVDFLICVINYSERNI